MSFPTPNYIGEKKATKEPKNTVAKKPKEVRTLMYEFSNILDPGISFGARHAKKRYRCDDGGQIELPVDYAKALNTIKFKFPHIFIDDEGNRVRKMVVKRRFSFVPIEVL